jgi:choline dehydrogenase-like flavoprotein
MLNFESTTLTVCSQGRFQPMIDDLRAGESTTSIDADVLIAGAGAAGVTLALALARAGISVCVLESGGLAPEPDTQALSHGDNTGYWVSLNAARPRVLGGATSRWGGRMAKLDPEDLAPRPWANAPGWPVKYEELAAYYPDAARICGLREPWGDDRQVLQRLLPGRDWNWNGGVRPFVWRYGASGFRRYTHWGEVYRDELKDLPNLRLILHANLTGFEAGEDGKVTAVTARALSGRTIRVTGRSFVLCCGGIENARLLLASAESIPGGVHQGNPLVGGFFMQHPRGGVASITGGSDLGLKLQDVFNVFTRRRPPQYEVGFALSQEVQAKEKLLNCSAVLQYDADPASGWELIKDKLRRSVRRSSNPSTPKRRLTLFDVALIARNVWRRGFLGGHSLVAPRSVRVVVDVEQVSQAQSRITLADNRDDLGMRRVSIDWRLSDLERTTARRFAELLRDQFRALGIGEVVLEPWLDADGPIPEWALVDNVHHMGATRMGRTAKDGVVDKDLKVFGSKNVYVAGSSVFPSGGHANPTLTIVALTLRLADHLKAIHGKG